MKQYIILIGMIALGIFIFRLIMGSGDASVMATLEGFFRSEIERSAGAV
jgi:C4-dicarboxylate transporter